jgi:GNAT superfamily N-acetyltransferase
MIPEFNLRPFAPSDAQVVVHLINAAAQPLNTQRAVVDGAGNVRLARYVPPVSQKVVVTNRQNEVVGYAYLADRDQHIVYEVGGAVHPDYWQRGVGTMLLGWAEQQAGSASDDEKGFGAGCHFDGGMETATQKGRTNPFGPRFPIRFGCVDSVL